MTPSETERQLVVFSLHGDEFALPIGSVREIIRYTAPGVTALATGVVRGMINLRGSLLPVADLSSRMGQVLEVGADTRILVVDVANGSVGLIVDAVHGVLAVAESEISPLPASMADNDLGDRVAAVGDRLVMLIEPDRALGEALPSEPGMRRQGEVGPEPEIPGIADIPPPVPTRRRRTRRSG